MRRMTYLVALVAVLTALFVCTTHAQPAEPQPPGMRAPGEGAGERARDMQERRQRAQGMMQGGAPGIGGAMMGQPPAIAVADGFVFVVFGGTLFQFTVDGLQEVARAQLAPARQAAGGRQITPEMAEAMRQRAAERRGGAAEAAPPPVPGLPAP